MLPVEPIAIDPQAPREGDPKWRVGRQLGRTLYHLGKVVGLVDTAALAAELVEATTAMEDQEDCRHPDDRLWALDACAWCPDCGALRVGERWHARHAGVANAMEAPLFVEAVERCASRWGGADAAPCARAKGHAGPHSLYPDQVGG